ncbi:MAG: class I SAM-dependent methyltransferase [Candidatus Auribacterota bacterium]|nr:class I SAM-dependent methyltransferase [Candidatus Auribacterota bacterium]
MKSLEEIVVEVMDGSDAGLYPFLPYIMQDLWGLGTSPETIVSIIKKHTANYSNLRILDLGCGKGAVSITLAKEFNCRCLGIDAIADFIAFANDKAEKYGVSKLCKFEIGDIREKVKKLQNFDVVILGSIGPILGNYFTTLTTLAQIITNNGIIVIDDGYIEDASSFQHPLIEKKSAVLEQINKADMRLIDEVITGKNEITRMDDQMFAFIKERCLELTAKYPEKQKMFLDYITKQEEESDVLENKIICSAMVISKNG